MARQAWAETVGLGLGVGIRKVKQWLISDTKSSIQMGITSLGQRFVAR